MRLLVQHRSTYSYPRPASLGAHRIRLRPASHVRARVESYALHLSPPAQVRWQQDPSGNHVAQVTFSPGTALERLDVLVELALDVRPVNPFDFVVEERCERAPFEYPSDVALDLAPFLDRSPDELAAGPRFETFAAEGPRGGPTVPFVVALNEAVHRRVRYVLREEPGIWTPEETLAHGRGSCRDVAVLLVALCRAHGLAARFVSGYLVQLTDEGMIPGEPRGVDRDVVDLHAWAEVYLPGAGWIGLDATSGLLCGEGHVPLACVARPALAAPIDGTTDVAASEVRFETRIGRLGHEVRPTAPFPDDAWERLLAAGDAADEALQAAGLALTSGGEPTFNSREHADAPEWNGEALGPTKDAAGERLARAVRERLAPGAALLRGQGKWYPGESLPRWAIDVVGRADGQPLWQELSGRDADPATAERLARRLSERLGLPPPIAAYEDPWPPIRDEAALPVGVDPLSVDLADPLVRGRLARFLGEGPGRVVGWVVPMVRDGERWRGERWSFRRGRLFLLPGTGAMGLRLPLASLGGPARAPEPVEPALVVPDPRREAELRDAAKPRPVEPVRTALCLEPRDGAIEVFLPPLASGEDFLALLADVDAVRRELGAAVRLGGYPPPRSPLLRRITVAPDPGVLEVNVPPASSAREHVRTLELVHDAALHAGLHAQKHLMDGRLAGSGGGHHLTLGGPTVLESPFLRRPDVLASLVTFLQHHPSLSYLFTGLFVGPTSQAPRLDEARHDALYEMEIALAAAFDATDPPPWLADALFRHLLLDVTGNTHRAELSIDKLFDWRTPHGRQGIVELRAFEMPPHPRLAGAQAVLVRALLAALVQAPYRKPLVRWGAVLHDRFLLPTWLWRDFEDVLAFLAGRGVALPAEPYRAFVELRCPLAGRLAAAGVTLEVRNALEPWHVLGEEPGGGGTVRYVDSSVERIEVRAEGLVPERHRVLVNGLVLPMRATGVAGEAVGGVRFRAWSPAHALHPHLGIHHPVRIELFDGWSRRAVGACAYHVWHPEGRAFSTPPLTAFEAAARRAQRFTEEGPSPWPVEARAVEAHPDMPYTLDLRRFPGDRPMPAPGPAAEKEA